MEDHSRKTRMIKAVRTIYDAPQHRERNIASVTLAYHYYFAV
jgi:hypothetical protein